MIVRQVYAEGRGESEYGEREEVFALNRLVWEDQVREAVRKEVMRERVVREVGTERKEERGEREREHGERMSGRNGWRNREE